MRTFEFTHTTDDDLIRIRATETGRVLAAFTGDEARHLWINLGAGLGLGTEPLTVRNVERASSLRDLSKCLKKNGSHTKK